VPVINLPSGETFEVPYEGSDRTPLRGPRASCPSARGRDRRVPGRGEPDRRGLGQGPAAARHRKFFEEDPVRGNIAELAFGCNDRAVVTGNVLEDEKAGFHWAFGRSDHLGGTVGVDAFRSPATVVHQDIVYAKGSPISISRADLIAADGRRTTVIQDGAYVLW